MLHIAMNLVRTKLGTEFKKLTADLEGLVKPEYLHSSLVILTKTDFSDSEMQIINRIANSASEKIGGLTEFLTGDYATDNNGYLTLETKFEGLDAIIADMEEAFEDAGFDFLSKRPFHATIIKGVFGSESEIAEAMHKMNVIMGNESLKNGLCNKTFSIEGAVYSQAGYPKGSLAGTVEIIQAFHEFKEKEHLLENTVEEKRSSLSL